MKRRISERRREREAEAPVSPMDGVANLADVMLVLAVGIMLALIINWNVDISYHNPDSSDSGEETAQSTTQPEQKNELPITEDDMTEPDENEETPEAMQKLGVVYFDEATGKYYLIKADTDD